MVTTIDHLTSNLADNSELYEMSKDDGDFDGLLAIEADAAKLEATIAELEFRRMFNNPADPSNCFIDIQAGAGGTEACDWAAMLLRQYLKYCERKGFKTEVMEETAGDVAGIRSADHQGRGRVRLRPAAHRDRRAPAGAQEPVRFRRRPPHQLREPVRLSRGRRLDRDRHQPGRRAHRHLPRLAARAASTSTRPTRRCA